MKFLLVVLVVHFVAELIRTQKNKIQEEVVEESNKKAVHPAEFSLR